MDTTGKLTVGMGTLDGRKCLKITGSGAHGDAPYLNTHFTLTGNLIIETEIKALGTRDHDLSIGIAQDKHKDVHWGDIKTPSWSSFCGDCAREQILGPPSIIQTGTSGRGTHKSGKRCIQESWHKDRPRTR